MLSNTASVELIYQWIYKNRRNLIRFYHIIYHIMNAVVVFVCCFYLLLSSLLSYSSRYAEDINKILLLLHSSLLSPTFPDTSLRCYSSNYVVSRSIVAVVVNKLCSELVFVVNAAASTRPNADISR